MSVSLDQSDFILREAIDAFGRDRDALFDALRALPAPIYVTDAEGWVIFANEACVKFSGRRPAVGKDRWCVTWKLYTEDGEVMPHGQCPMAVALVEKRSVRGVSAVAERPDGTRVTFVPFPTPLFDDKGELAGAVNMFIDITEVRQIEELRREAERCRWLAGSAGDPGATKTLRSMSQEYLTKAKALERRMGPPEGRGA